MKKILIVLLVSLAWPCVAWAACCTSIVLGPTAWLPEFVHGKCTMKSNKANYGGTANLKADATATGTTAVTEIARLKQSVPGVDPTTVTSRTAQETLNCNATTSVSIWTLSPSCNIMSGSRYFVEYSIFTAPCGGQNGQTTTVTSAIVTCP